MSDSDDWENAADDMIADKPEETKGAEEGKFADEDAVDSDDERKKEEEKKAAARAAAANEPKKVKTSKKDYEKMYADRQGAGAKKAA